MKSPEPATNSLSDGEAFDPLIGAWQTAVAAPPISTSVDYSADGSAAGRDEFITNGVDFAVTGVPFTNEELAKLTLAKKTFVYVPIAGGSLACGPSAPQLAPRR